MYIVYRMWTMKIDSHRTMQNVRVGLVFIAHCGSNVLLVVKFMKSSHNSTYIHISFETSSKMYDNNYDVA